VSHIVKLQFSLKQKIINAGSLYLEALKVDYQKTCALDQKLNFRAIHKTPLYFVSYFYDKTISKHIKLKYFILIVQQLERSNKAFNLTNHFTR
jgi:hypothetical protein